MFSPFGPCHSIFFLGASKGSASTHNGACMIKFTGPSAVRAAYEAILTLNFKVILPGCPSPVQVGLARGWEHLDLASELRRQGYFRRARASPSRSPPPRLPEPARRPPSPPGHARKWAADEAEETTYQRRVAEQLEEQAAASAEAEERLLEERRKKRAEIAARHVGGHSAGA